MIQKLYSYTLQPGREGWIYLIHALGTCRYKIGRSINPITRYETLKVQSPYPLQIISTVFSMDSVTDETSLHEKYKHCRVHGEWFEFNHCTPERMCGLIDHTNYDSTFLRLVNNDICFLEQFLPTCTLHELKDRLTLLHYLVKDRGTLVSVEQLIRKDIPEHLGLSGLGHNSDSPFRVSTIEHIKQDEQNGNYNTSDATHSVTLYLSGLLEGAIMSLKRSIQ